MFCPRCGNANVTTKFCPRCGAAVPQAPDAGAPALDEAATSSWYTHEESAYQANYERQADIHVQQQQAMSSGHKVRKLVPSVAETQSLFEKLKSLFFETETFFTENNMSRELGTAISIVLVVSAATFIARLLLPSFFRLIERSADTDYSVLALASLFVFGLCPVSTMFAFAYVYATDREKANWKNIFSVFGYAFLPYIITLTPVPFMRVFCMAVFIWLSTVGFENVFNIPRGRALILSAGAPILYVALTALITSKACFIAFIK
jgi:hypothetical protein